MLSRRYSWLAVKGISDNDLLEITGLHDADYAHVHVDEARLYRCIRTRSGWTILLTNSFDLKNKKIIDHLSGQREVVLCQFVDESEEPSCALMSARNGEMLWEISASREDLSVCGTPPSEFTLLHQKYIGSINEYRLMKDEFLFALGDEICGFRHDRYHVSKALLPRADSPLHGMKYPHNLWGEEDRPYASWAEAIKAWVPLIGIFLIATIIVLLGDLVDWS